MSPHRIVTVPILPRGMVNSFLLIGERPVVVDTGVPGSAPKVLAALAREGFAPGDVSLILITHRHVDHIGSAAAVKRATGAPVAVHALDAEWLRKGDGGTRPPTGWGGRLLDLTGLPSQRAAPCAPDLVIDRDLPLAPYGVSDGVVLHTPGHTPGSISALFPNGDVLAGDLVIGGISFLGGIARLGHARKPPFEDDPGAVRQSLTGLLDRGASRFFVGHGGPLMAREVRRYIAREPRLGIFKRAAIRAA
ncbi:MBL fold metallo-hydrolase [Lichenifustis flavocetrariae]|uniref:MBL fold metallo-hydrolase n=1 Tax=Lichenifustis flavocetrariae TaxID=2949735 RepID=A0AA41YTD8_9HYPH|nr:MBL fold metallo-hydrolase [Lichenifustis flavocetrariae]MCW6507809.1 MBL fold metallo-hydrolase [Lichenifustis flavocetrariae]